MRDGGVVHAAACWYPPGHAIGLREDETERDLFDLSLYAELANERLRSTSRRRQAI
jgi:hypothetical protein